MTAGWRKLMAGLPSKRMHLGLSRFARWCSGKEIPSRGRLAMVSLRISLTR